MKCRHKGNITSFFVKKVSLSKSVFWLVANFGLKGGILIFVFCDSLFHKFLCCGGISIAIFSFVLSAFDYTVA